MDPIQFAIRNPVKVTVGVILLLLFGLLAFINIPVQLTPNVDRPVVTVTTDWIGRSPQEIERDIIEPQEDVLKNVTGLRKMTATASQNQGQIVLEFKVGTDIMGARQEVSDSLREVPDYPEDVEEPVINTGEPRAESPVAWMILSSNTPSFDVQSLGDSAEERIKPYLERIDGVSEVRVYGGREQEVHIEIDPRRLAQRGISFNAFRQALQLENVNVSAGDLNDGKYDVRIRTLGQYEALEQVRNTIVRTTDGGPVRVRDLGEVKLTLEKRRAFVRSKGEVAIAMPVLRETGANVIQIMEELDDRLVLVNNEILPQIARQVQLDQGLDAPPDIRLRKVYDETVYIDDALALVQNNLFIGGTLAGLVLLVFLRSVRPTLVVMLAIPISVIGTFVVMWMAGRNVNVISLAGLAFAVGMVVDAAIVVLENIDRHLLMGKSPIKAAYHGAREVWGAILASTLTTLAVFIPVLTIEEEAGQLFRDIALAICAAVSLSLIVSVTVIPSASSRFLRPHTKPKMRIVQWGRSLMGLAPVLAKFGDAFASFVYWCLRPTPAGLVLRLAIVAGLTLAAVVGAMVLMPPTDYLPRGNQNIVFGFIIKPPGYNLDHDEFIAKRIESRIAPYWSVDTYEAMADLPPAMNFLGPEPRPIENLPPIDNFFFVSGSFGTFAGATSVDKENVQPLGTLLTSAVNTTVPGLIGFAQQISLFRQSGDRSVEVEVIGDNLDSVRESAAALYGALAQRYGVMTIRPNPINFTLQGPELQWRIDRVRAADLGVDSNALGLGNRALVDGITIGEYRHRGEAIDIVARRNPQIPISPDRMRSTPLAYTQPDGTPGTVYLGQIAEARYDGAPQSIYRVEELRAVSLSVNAPAEEPLETMSAEIQSIVGQLRQGGAIRGDVEVQLAGSADKLADVREALLGQYYPGKPWKSAQSLLLSRIFLAVLVTYLLMAALFESFLYPFVIMFSVPLATVGGFLGLAIVHAITPSQNLDVLTMLGFVILIGVVVNNAILIVHQALNFIRGLGETESDKVEALQPREAIRESVRTRIRPVFMTTMTSMFGMAPLVLMPGSGSELYRGLGSVVLGGLLVATVFTLVVVPLTFAIVLDAQGRLYKLMGWGEPDLGTVEPEALTA